MGWKDWPYWVKGGIIAIIVHIILLPLLLLSIWTSYSTPPTDAGAIGAAILFGASIGPFISPFIFGILPMPIPFSSVVGYYLIGFIFPIIIYFILGAIIGLVYGKIKSRKD